MNLQVAYYGHTRGPALPALDHGIGRVFRLENPSLRAHIRMDE
jgi:hypothetical protein